MKKSSLLYKQKAAFSDYPNSSPQTDCGAAVFILEIGSNQNKSGPTLQYQHYNGNIEVEVKCLLIGDNSICLFP